MAHTTRPAHRSTTAAGVRRSPIRTAAGVVGAVFLLVGIAGFIPGLTSNLDQLEFASHDSGAKLLDLFQVSVLHNIVHLAFGVLGLWAAFAAPRVARTYLVAGGAIYLVLWLYGLVIDKLSDANFVPVNRADDWLHFALGVAMVALGLLLSRDRHEGAVDPRLPAR